MMQIAHEDPIILFELHLMLLCECGDDYADAVSILPCDLTTCWRHAIPWARDRNHYCEQVDLYASVNDQSIKSFSEATFIETRRIPKEIEQMHTTGHLRKSCAHARMFRPVFCAPAYWTSVRSLAICGDTTRFDMENWFFALTICFPQLTELFISNSHWTGIKDYVPSLHDAIRKRSAKSSELRPIERILLQEDTVNFGPNSCWEQVLLGKSSFAKKLGESIGQLFLCEYSSKRARDVVQSECARHTVCRPYTEERRRFERFGAYPLVSLIGEMRDPNIVVFVQYRRG